MFRTLELALSYRSGRQNIASEFLVPLLSRAERYDRAAGYFSSASLSVLIGGLGDFVRGGGRIRLVASPQLSDADVQQITEGLASREETIESSVRQTLEELGKLDELVFSKLAWLIANEVLEIKLAIPTGSLAGIYHEKFGIFYNQEDTVAFTGSLNETGAALLRNIEHIDVYSSWREPERVRDKIEAFEALWAGEAPGIRICTFPEAVRDELIVRSPVEYPSANVSTLVRELRPEQVNAIQKWDENFRSGILAMATGTGKTLTAISIARRCIDDGAKTVVVLVPQIALANQWSQELSDVVHADILTCHNKTDWRIPLGNMAILSRSSPSALVIVSTYDTAASDDFRRALSDLGSPQLLIVDEVHNVSPAIASNLLLDTYEYRLGLSATPARHLDDDGSQLLINYFSGIVHTYGLKDAIRDKRLTPYRYEPIVCDSRNQGAAGMTAISSARVHAFENAFPGSVGYDMGYCLIYCAPDQVYHVKRYLGHELNLRIHSFTAEEAPAERTAILNDFASGDLHSLVAIRCLDEGIDVPATRFAYLLASSENPKQFIQRRGRVLRKAEGKTEAVIYDFLFITKPQTERQRLRLEKELTRFAEFANIALNADEAVDVLRRAAAHYGIQLRDYLADV